MISAWQSVPDERIVASVYPVRLNIPQCYSVLRCQVFDAIELMIRIKQQLDRKGKYNNSSAAYMMGKVYASWLITQSRQATDQLSTSLTALQAAKANGQHGVGSNDSHDVAQHFQYIYNDYKWLGIHRLPEKIFRIQILDAVAFLFPNNLDAVGLVSDQQLGLDLSCVIGLDADWSRYM